MDDRAQRVSVPIVWVGAEEVDVKYANQFLLQLDNDQAGVIFTSGMASPPVILGTPEQMEEQARNIPFVQVRAVSRIAMTRARFKEFAELVNRVGDAWPEEGSSVSGGEET